MSVAQEANHRFSLTEALGTTSDYWSNTAGFQSGIHPPRGADNRPRQGEVRLLRGTFTALQRRKTMPNSCMNKLQAKGPQENLENLKDNTQREGA